MKTIRIDDEVWRALQSRARKPFEDTPNSVLREMLGLDNACVDEPAEAEPDEAENGVKRTQEDAFKRPILEELVRVGGEAHATEVLNKLESNMKRGLSDHDLQRLNHGRGEVRWRNTAKWARKHMIDEGFMKSGMPHGIWGVTDAGRRYLSK